MARHSTKKRASRKLRKRATAKQMRVRRAATQCRGTKKHPVTQREYRACMRTEVHGVL